jgi:hypothetical protein
MLILQSPDPNLSIFYREMKCDGNGNGNGLIGNGNEEKCRTRLAQSLGQRVHLGKILINWEEKNKFGKL